MLTKCIEKLSGGLIPEEPLVVQLLDYWRVRNPTYGYLVPDGRLRGVLSDGNHCASTSLYFQDRNYFRPLPTKKSILIINSLSFF